MSKILKSERNRLKKAARQLLYPEWVQSALDKAQTEEEASRIMTIARKENSNYWKDRK
jgi:hypothetical protein